MKFKTVYILINLALFIGCSGSSAPYQQRSRLDENFTEGERSMIQQVEKTDDEWKKILTDEQYWVMRKGGTERPFSGKYNDHHENGIYHCAGCGTPLFSSKSKYDHGTGWPSFTSPTKEEYLEYREDNSLAMKRTEVICAICGAHLGHVFNDGPPPTYTHYCINSVALNFVSADSPVDLPSSKTETSGQKGKNLAQREKATFAAGCFWSVEHKFRQVKGVTSTTVGYTGGYTKKPNYKQVCTGTTGHAEAVSITYDPTIISYSDLLEVFFTLHDPTQLNRQGSDIGPQYRSVIFYHKESQKKAALEMIWKLNNSGPFHQLIVTQVIPVSEFYKAEEYHQQYIEKQPKGNKK